MIWDGVEEVQGKTTIVKMDSGLSGLVLDNFTCNQVYEMKCDNVEEHLEQNCRKNFYGSVKAMEPHVAKNLIVNSSILQSGNAEVRVLLLQYVGLLVLTP